MGMFDFVGDLFGGDSSGIGNSSSKESTTNNNKQANLTSGNDSQNTFVESGATLNASDLGAVRLAFDAIEKSSAKQGEGFTKLLDAAKDMFNNSATATGNAYAQAEANKAGAIDQKTMMVLAALGAAVVIFAKKKGG